LNVRDVFEKMPERYRKGSAESPITYYFSVGDDKFTVFVEPESCRVEAGKVVEKADVVLKTTPELFERMVIKGKMPGTMDIMRGRIKTNDPMKLQKLKDMFEFPPA
jgi:putative sterol carrier protein